MDIDHQLEILRYGHEVVLLDRVRISTQKIFHSPILFVISQIEGNTIGPPPIVETLCFHKLLPGLCFKLHEFAVPTFASRGHTHPRRAQIDFGDLDPGPSEVPSWSI